MESTTNKIRVVGGKKQVGDTYITLPNVELEYGYYATDHNIIDKVKEIIGAIKNDS